MKKCKILIPIGCRSDEGLSEPIIRRLRLSDKFYVKVMRVDNPGNFEEVINNFDMFEHNYKPDIVFITGDRVEMTAIASVAFHNNVPIAHYYAGILNDPLSTLDDINRHVISLWSEIQFVESWKCFKNIYALFSEIKKKHNCHIVGITHMENLEIDISLVPKSSYDLVLLNPTTMYEEVLSYDIKRFRFVIGPNPDGEVPFPTFTKFGGHSCMNVSRPQFLGLLKWCSRFITNSSSAIYEAPYFLKPDQIVMVGDRNKNRTPFTYEKPDKLASEKIMELLKEWWREKNEMV